jgi:hypothetical protein
MLIVGKVSKEVVALDSSPERVIETMEIQSE